MAGGATSQVNDWQTVEPGDWQTVSAATPAQQPQSATHRFFSNALDTIKSAATALNPEQFKEGEVPAGWHPEAKTIGERLKALALDLPIVAQVHQALGGDVAGAAGALAPGLVTGGLAALPEGTAAKVGTAAKGAAVGAAKATVEPVNYGHLRLPVPAPIAGAGAGGYAAHQLGLPSELGAAVGAAVPIVRGAIKGAKAALSDRMAAAVESLKSPGQSLAEADGKVWTKLKPAEQQTYEDIARAQQNTASQANSTPAQPAPQPTFQPRALLTAGARQMPPAQDTSFVRAVPAQYPTVEKPAAPAPVESPAVPAAAKPMSTAQAEAAMARMKPATEEPGRTAFSPTGEVKSPQLRAQERINANTQAKAERFAQALHENGVTSADLTDIPAGRLSETQIAKGGMPGWGNITDDLVSKGFLNSGETEPATSLPKIFNELRKLEKAKAAQSQVIRPPKGFSMGDMKNYNVTPIR